MKRPSMRISVIVFAMAVSGCGSSHREAEFVERPTELMPVSYSPLTDKDTLPKPNQPLGAGRDPNLPSMPGFANEKGQPGMDPGGMLPTAGPAGPTGLTGGGHPLFQGPGGITGMPPMPGMPSVPGRPPMPMMPDTPSIPGMPGRLLPIPGAVGAFGPMGGPHSAVSTASASPEATPDSLRIPGTTPNFGSNVGSGAEFRGPMNAPGFPQPHAPPPMGGSQNPMLPGGPGISFPRSPKVPRLPGEEPRRVLEKPSGAPTPPNAEPIADELPIDDDSNLD